MRVFIAGATGAIGKRAVHKLVASGHSVTGVARSPAARTVLERARAAAVNVDLFDRDAVRRAIEGHDAVVNVATHIPRGRIRPFFPSAWAENDRLRREASAILGEAAAVTGARVFIQESIALAYPDSGEQWVTDDMKLEPSRYARAVRDAEASAARFTASGGRGVTLRFAAFYGPDDFATEQLLLGARRGFLPLFGRVDAHFPMVHHEDASQAVVTALDAPAGVYNVVDDEPLRRGELAAVIADLLGVSVPRLPPAWLSFFAGPLGEVMARSVRASNRKLRQLGWAPSYPTAREGLRAVLAARQPTARRAEPVAAEGRPGH
jgi:2-alkyl-3-oxoalkanoate reductase